MKSEDKTSDAERDEFQREAMSHIDALYSTALRLTRSAADAEDLVQDSILRAYRFYDRFEAGTNFRAWLFKILTNTFINRYRRSMRERNVLEGTQAAPVGDGVMSRSAMRALFDPTGDAQRSLLAGEIQAALETLPEDYRLMILLADVEELSYREIADIVGCPIGTVMSRLHRARRLLQVHLVDQAAALGILPAVEENVSERTPQQASVAAVSLEDYRRRRSGVS